MKWNKPEVQPRVAKELDWMTESDPVLCKVSFFNENNKRLKSYCVCTYNTYKNSVSGWEPLNFHLSVSTMPIADYSIERAKGFTVLFWTEIFFGLKSP